ncbi:MAG: tetratricopeptide repeat protein [Gemmatimonadota bacterium]
MTAAGVEALFSSLRAEYRAIEAGLESATALADREELKRRIVALFKRTDAALGHLSGLKEEIRLLVDRYKQLSIEAAGPEPEFTGARPPVHHDHIGASTFIEKGWSLISLGDHVAAIQALSKALELSPRDVHALSLLGWAQMLNQQYDDALATFSRVLAAEPANALARVNVGFICLKKRIFGEAIEHLSRAIRLDNDRKATLYAHYYLGLVYLEREMYLDAQTFLEKAVALGPNLIEAFYDLGRVHWLQKAPEPAKEAWRRGAAANRFAPWAKRCQEVLDELERGGAPPHLRPV